MSHDTMRNVLIVLATTLVLGVPLAAADDIANAHVYALGGTDLSTDQYGALCYAVATYSVHPAEDGFCVGKGIITPGPRDCEIYHMGTGTCVNPLP
ncbi:MAG: hypothetical protein QOE90_3601 [Thermoplasmata archaeon]|jgi:hypothetical protein|nr:hypothetical protein [Thermoplasmata archaeon]